MRVLLKTNHGDITLELNEEKAPETVGNFLEYVNEGFYSGTIFHRVIADFMIQGGGFDAEMKEKTTRAPIINEADNGLLNEEYTVAMARTREPHSATAQFFINTKNNEFLNFTAKTVAGWGYAVFGRVVEGREIVDSIKMVETAIHDYHDDVPKEPVVIEEAKVIG